MTTIMGKAVTTRGGGGGGGGGVEWSMVERGQTEFDPNVDRFHSIELCDNCSLQFSVSKWKLVSRILQVFYLRSYTGKMMFFSAFLT